MNKNEYFAEWIMSVRIIKGWSQNYVAKQIGVSKQLVCKWESGISKPPSNPRIRRAIADTFGVTMSDIFDDEATGYHVTRSDRIAIRRGYALYAIRLSYEDTVNILAQIYRVSTDEIEYILKTTPQLEKKVIQHMVYKWEGRKSHESTLEKV